MVVEARQPPDAAVTKAVLDAFDHLLCPDFRR